MTEQTFKPILKNKGEQVQINPNPIKRANSFDKTPKLKEEIKRLKRQRTLIKEANTVWLRQNGKKQQNSIKFKQDLILWLVNRNKSVDKSLQGSIKLKLSKLRKKQLKDISSKDILIDNENQEEQDANKQKQEEEMEEEQEMQEGEEKKQEKEEEKQSEEESEEKSEQEDQSEEDEEEKIEDLDEDDEEEEEEDEEEDEEDEDFGEKIKKKRKLNGKKLK